MKKYLAGFLLFVGLGCVSAQQTPPTTVYSASGADWKCGSFSVTTSTFGEAYSALVGYTHSCPYLSSKTEDTCSSMQYVSSVSGGCRYVYSKTGEGGNDNVGGTITWSGSCPGELSLDSLSGLCYAPVVNKTNGPPPPGESRQQPSTCLPITLSTGNKWLKEEDLAANGDLGLVRYYNSTEPSQSSRWGRNWSAQHFQNLNLTYSASQAYSNRSQGTSLAYLKDTGGNYTGQPDAKELFQQTINSVTGAEIFTITLNDRLEQYNSQGLLSTVRYLSGLEHAYQYDANQRLVLVQSSTGRSLSFQYDSFNRVRSVIYPGGVLQYTYDTLGNLTQVTYPDGKSKTYHYNETGHTSGANLPFALTGIIDENNVRTIDYYYDTQGRAISEIEAGGVGAYQLGFGTNTTTVTNPLNSSFTYNFQTILGVPKNISSNQPPGSGCGASSSAMAYDPTNGNLVSQDNFQGERICYAYDAKNQETTRVEGLASSVDCATVLPANATLPANARKITTSYHPDWRMATVITAPGTITTSIYQGQSDPFNGNEVANCTTAPDMPNGKPLPVLCKQVVQATLPSGALDTNTPNTTTRYTYNTAGKVLTATDSLNRTTSYIYYDASSFGPDMESVTLLLSGSGADGSTSVLDSSLEPVPVTAAGNARISTAQSRFGGSSLYFDGSRDYVSMPAQTKLVMGASDFTIEMWIYKLANNENDSRLWNPDGDLVADVYLGINSRGSLEAYGSSSGSSWNAWGFNSGPTIPNGVWTHVALVRVGGTVRLFIDGVGRVLTSELGSAALYDGGFTHVIGGQGVGDDRAFNGYIDEVRVTRGIGRYVTNFTPPNQEFPRVDPNPVGHRVADLQSITNSAGFVTTFNSYDKTGRVLKTTDPKGIVTDMTYTPRGWVSTVTTTAPSQSARTTSYTYDNVGQLTGVTNPDGSTLAYSYDAAHRLIGATDAKGNSVTYTLDNMGNRIKEDIKDPGGVLQRSINRSFDALNRLQQVTGAVP